MKTVPIQISAWNIHGFMSKILGNKLTDSTFMSEIKNDDVVTLVETHNSSANDKLSIPGFKRVSVKNRDSKGGGAD